MAFHINLADFIFLEISRDHSLVAFRLMLHFRDKVIRALHGLNPRRYDELIAMGSDHLEACLSEYRHQDFLDLIDLCVSPYILIQAVFKYEERGLDK